MRSTRKSVFSIVFASALAGSLFTTAACSMGEDPPDGTGADVDEAGDGAAAGLEPECDQPHLDEDNDGTADGIDVDCDGTIDIPFGSGGGGGTGPGGGGTGTGGGSGSGGGGGGGTGPGGGGSGGGSGSGSGGGSGGGGTGPGGGGSGGGSGGGTGGGSSVSQCNVTISVNGESESITCKRVDGGPATCECRVDSQLVSTCTTNSTSACSIGGTNANCCGFGF